MRGVRRLGRLPYGSALLGSVRQCGGGRLRGLSCRQCNPVMVAIEVFCMGWIFVECDAFNVVYGERKGERWIMDKC